MQTGRDAIPDREVIFSASMQVADAYASEALSRLGIAGYQPSDEDMGIFSKVAEMCIRNSWDPVDYVHKAFVPSRHLGGCMLPSDLLSKARIKSYPSTLGEESRGPSPGEEAERCKKWILDQELGGASEHDLLMSPASPLPAWFRVAYPERPEDGLLRAWGCIAWEELCLDPSRVEIGRGLSPAWNVVLERLRKEYGHGNDL